jgi:Na+-driven multidrug efflux pump
MKEVSLFILILNSLLMYIFQEEILKNFTQNLEILVEARKVYWLICVTVVFEGFNCMLRGVIKAMNL